MLLYVVRHANAADPAEYATDEERPLTELGHDQVRRLAAALSRYGAQLSVILSSPLVRAWQTAEELRVGWKSPPPLRECTPLEPGGEVKELTRLLEDQTGNAAIVGHNPDLERHIAWLIGSRKARVAMAKGAVACLDCRRPLNKGCATLRWLITPDFC